jgi:hypothetical protein
LGAPPTFKVVSQTGSTTSLPPATTPDPIHGSWESEESLDVEWAHALAPGANILLVECNSPSFADLFSGVAYAASAPGVSVVSMSFGGSEASLTQSEVAAFDQTFTTPTGHPGVTFLASSGDQGAFPSNGPLAIEFPSASPNVVSVGGTTINTDFNGNPIGESAWTGSGGGVSALETQTAAQRAAVGTYSGRANPDVAFDADPQSGVNICDSFDFAAATPFAVFGGTSFSSPAWAAILAIANQGRVAAGLAPLDGQFQTIPDLYAAYTNGSYSSVLKDITTGANQFYPATKGYDLATGLGSPTVKPLVSELVSNLALSTPPTIGTFAVNPLAENPGTSVTLSASNVTDTAGIVTGVNFYRLNGAVKTLLGAGTLDASGNWTLSISTAGLAVGTYIYRAVATNNFKQNSKPATTTNQVAAGAAPTIANFKVSPLTEPFGDSVELTATGVTDASSKIATVAFYLQSGASRVLLGNGTNPGAGKWTLTASTLGLPPGLYTYVAIAIAASGLVSTPATATNAVTATTPITILVNTTKDQTDPRGSKTVSLRDAVAIADAGGAAVTVEFDPKVFAKFQTIVLTGASLSLTATTAPTAIVGPAAGVAISGNHVLQVFSIGPGTNVSLSNLTITNGLSSAAGGGLINSGNATLANVTMNNNVASGLAGNGGGIENDGTLTLLDSTITGNTSAKGSGGGIYNTGTVTATLTTISGNLAATGAGLGNKGSAALTDSTVAGNGARSTGGGVLNFGTLALVTSTISGNVAGSGGGLYNLMPYGSSTGTLATLTNSTVAKNFAFNNYGGIYNSINCDLIVTDSTISQNAASYYGGVDNSGTAVIANTIIAGNSASTPGASGVDVMGPFISQGHNLIGETDGSSGWTASDFTGTHPKPLAADLTPLGNFGGPTQTVVPFAGSPALGNGSISLIPIGIFTDQRGDLRVVAGKVDIGSVENQGGSTLKINSPAGQAAVAGTSTAFKLGSLTGSTTNVPFTVIVNWGDGSPDTTTSLNSTGTIPVQSHLFALPGTFTVSVVAVDDQGDSSNAGRFSVKVAPPHR